MTYCGLQTHCTPHMLSGHLSQAVVHPKFHTSSTHLKSATENDHHRQNSFSCLTSEKFGSVPNRSIPLDHSHASHSLFIHHRTVLSSGPQSGCSFLAVSRTDLQCLSFCAEYAFRRTKSFDARKKFGSHCQKRLLSVRCTAGNGRTDTAKSSNITNNAANDEQSEPWVVRVAVDLFTEGLRVLQGERPNASPQIPSLGLLEPSEGGSSEIGKATAAEVMRYVQADYEDRAYFLTGDITDSIYSDDCYFGDPTVKFSGREKWKRNIRLLVPYFEEPSIELKGIGMVEEEGVTRIKTTWRLRTFLRFPWRPLIDLNGSTVHTLNEENTQVIRHVESWEISGLEAIGQMFVPSRRSP
eukprot:TRINITY_DN7763_c0_g2_i1.p1 TRINITY_DN7763_c0_g2~~TRINITY_DN7763_c0_g2_i1.p1  ORF type:complete len:354 (+),score=9.70 TRINITY_DN7763_c0_g2_i1:442-1503(+)